MATAIASTPPFLSACLPSAPRTQFSDLEQFRSDVHSHLLRLLYKPELRIRADDLTQETFIRAFKFIESGQEVRSNGIKSWLLRIATRVFLDDRRHSKRRVDALSLDDNPASSNDLGLSAGFDLADSHDEHQQIADLRNIGCALAHLEPKQRELLLASNDGLDYNEIAKKFQISLGCVRSRLHRARENATYYGVLEGVVEITDLTASAQVKVLRRVAALEQKFNRYNDPKNGAELAIMQQKISAIISQQDLL